ncbi:MAG: prolyl oligopeptidase family serine peptidase, partial [Acidobacteriota bacterium]
HQGRFFYVVSSHLEGDYELWRRPVDGSDAWSSYGGPRVHLHMERIFAFADYLVVLGREAGLRQVWVKATAGPGEDWHRVSLPGEAAVIHLEENREYAGTRLRLGYCSLDMPYAVLSYDMARRSIRVEKESPVGGDFESRNYVSRRLLAEASDGAQVPISLVYREDLRRPEGHPVVLYTYGAYGYCLEPEFDPARLSLLDRGVIFAMAHVRGGGELGVPWREAGRLGRKRNSFSDCIACAEHLLRTGYAAKGRVALMGDSAGGLVVGAVLNMRPELFAAAVTDCPFVDVLDTLSDPSLPLSVSDWEEFGNPADPDVRAYIRSYSPCDNVRPQDYPALYVTAGFQDPRVAFWEPAKWVDLLRRHTRSQRPIVFEVDLEAGHWGTPGQLGYYRDLARKYAFLLSWLAPDASV